MSPTASSLQGVDPSAPGNIIRVALAFESLITVVGGAYLMFFPRHFFLRTMRTPVAEVTATAVQCIQYVGSMSVILGTAIALFIPNTKQTIESRRMLYVGVLGIEIVLVPQLVWQAMMTDGGMPRKSLLIWAALLVPFMVWRTVSIGWKKEWFGRYQDGKKVK